MQALGGAVMDNRQTNDEAKESSAAQEPPAECIFDFGEVRRAELDKIRERRKKLHPPRAVECDAGGVPVDLVGLALSGGGIRAASVGLGALQALYTAKHWTEFDYLSTVSGGGYIGGYVRRCGCLWQDSGGVVNHQCRAEVNRIRSAFACTTFHLRRKVFAAPMGGRQQVLDRFVLQ